MLSRRSHCSWSEGLGFTYSSERHVGQRVREFLSICYPVICRHAYQSWLLRQPRFELNQLLPEVTVLVRGFECRPRICH